MTYGSVSLLVTSCRGTAIILPACRKSIRMLSYWSNFDHHNRSACRLQSISRRFTDRSNQIRALHSEQYKSNDGKPRLGSNSPNSKSSQTSDPPIVSWVDNYVPASLRVYARLSRMDKPIGTWLLLWPCYWSTTMAANSAFNAQSTSTIIENSSDTLSNHTDFLINNVTATLPDPYLLGLFTVGAFVMRGAGCTINDLWDKDFDAKVRRTADRPLARGEVTTPQAIAWLAVQLSVGLGVLLSLPHTYYTFCWGAASLPFVVIYPLMKRYTNYPQRFLGMTFNWGAWMGWAATFGSMDYSVIAPLYVSGIAWTMVYDTIYANQDKHDDASLGLKSTALTFGTGGDTQQKKILKAFASVAYCTWILAGYNLYNPLDESGSPVAFGVYFISLIPAYEHLMWQIETANLNDPHNLAERFRSNTVVGGMVFGSILAGNIAGASF